MLDVAVIDTGIDQSHPIFKGCNIRSLDIMSCNGNYVVQENGVDEVGHGTAVAGIIAKMAPNIKLTMYKIQEDLTNVQINKIIDILEYIYLNENCNIVHMSLGTIEYSSELEAVCQRLYKKGTIIVAAYDNNGAVSYPAAFDCVIGVNATYKFTKTDEYEFIENGIVNINTRLGPNRIAWLKHQYIIDTGTSYSAAYITAHICCLMKEQHVDMNTILSLLRDGAIQIIKEKKTKNNQFSFDSDLLLKNKRVAIFPYNKEMHSLVNFNMLLEFELTHIYDHIYSGKVRKKVRSIINDKVYEIMDYRSMDFKKIDTLIIGHLDRINAGVTQNLKNELLDQCLENNVNAYCFDDIGTEKYIQLFHKKGLQLYIPSCKIDLAEQYKFGKLYCITQPILGIFGTSSIQGKFTLQLQLRKLFLANGYKIEQIGTEPTSQLFGMNEVLPFGYNSTTYLQEDNFIEYINSSLHRLSKKNPDIILCGAQSGTIPQYTFNVSLYNIKSIEYLLGMNPDGIIYCVNIYDDIDYIKRSIDAMENLVECKVIALAVSSLGFDSQWNQLNNRKKVVDSSKIEKFKKDVFERLHIQSFTIGTQEIEQLYDVCIDYFSN